MLFMIDHALQTENTEFYGRRTTKNCVLKIAALNAIFFINLCIG